MPIIHKLECFLCKIFKQKSLARTNTLAYLPGASIMIEKVLLLSQQVST
jgi:hypothetical protein